MLSNEIERNIIIFKFSKKATGVIYIVNQQDN